MNSAQKGSRDAFIRKERNLKKDPHLAMIQISAYLVTYGGWLLLIFLLKSTPSIPWIYFLRLFGTCTRGNAYAYNTIFNNHAS